MNIRWVPGDWLILLAFSPCVPLRGDSMAATQSVIVSLSPNGKLTVPPAVTLLSGGVAFSAFTANLGVDFRARTSATGAATITVRATGNFAPSGGPSIPAGHLTYTCAAAPYGSACTSTQTVSTTVQTPVITLPSRACTGGGGTCSAADPASVNLSFRLENDVSIPTGTYSVQLTFTISST